MEKQEIPLPSGIEKHLDPRTNRYYFVDHNNKTTSWVDPRTNSYYDQRNPPIINNQKEAYNSKSPLQTVQGNQSQHVSHNEEKSCSKMSEIDEILNHCKALSEKIKAFTGSEKNREYLALEDQLEKLLIKLDGVQADGKQEVRDARKQAVKEIQAQLSLLEFKADTNAMSNNDTNNALSQPNNSHNT